MKTKSNLFRQYLVAIAFFSYITATFAQTNSPFKVSSNRIDHTLQSAFFHYGTSDGIDVITNGSSTVLDGFSDLIWGAFYQSQPNNPGLFSLYSVSAGGTCFTTRATGQTGILNSNPSVALEIGSANSLQQLKVNGTTVWGSDERMKKNINELSGSLSQLKLLRPVSYMFKEEQKMQTIPEKILKELDSESIAKMQKELEEAKVDNPLLKRDIYGFVAQDLQKVFPNLVYEDEKTGMFIR